MDGVAWSGDGDRTYGGLEHLEPAVAATQGVVAGSEVALFLVCEQFAHPG